MPIIMVLSKLGLIHTDDGSANVYNTYGSFLSYNFSSDEVSELIASPAEQSWHQTRKNQHSANSESERPNFFRQVSRSRKLPAPIFLTRNLI